MRRTSSVQGIRPRQSFALADAPRELDGIARDPGGVTVALRLTRRAGGHCASFDAVRGTFRACGSEAAPVVRGRRSLALVLPAAEAAAARQLRARHPRATDGGRQRTTAQVAVRLHAVKARRLQSLMRRLALTLALLLAAGIAGCGLGAGRGRRGRRALRSRATSAARRCSGRGSPGRARRRDRDAPAAAQLQGHDALRRRLRAVRSTASAGGREGGRPVDWFYYVNGVEATKGAAAAQRPRRRPHLVGPPRLGARRRRVPAVVGSFPEPFLHGAGRQAPARCASSAPTPQAPACATVAGPRSPRLGVPAATPTLRSTGRAATTLRVLVGTWTRAARATRALQPARGRPARERRLRRARARTARTLALLDPRGRGRRARSAPAPGWSPRRASAQDQPTWAITGTDDGRRRRRGARVRPSGRCRTTSRSRSARRRRPCRSRSGGGADDATAAAPARCTPRAPAVARAVRRSRSSALALVSTTRCCSARSRVRRARRRRRWRGVGPRAARAPRARACRSRCVIAVDQRARRARGADGDRAPRRRCRRSGRST